MAIRKSLDINDNGVVCEIWRVENIPFFRKETIVTVTGWTSEKTYKDDVEKVKPAQSFQFRVSDKEAEPEYKTASGDILMEAKEADTRFTKFFADSVLKKKDNSLLANSYEYLKTTDQFKDGELYQ